MSREVDNFASNFASSLDFEFEQHRPKIAYAPAEPLDFEKTVTEKKTALDNTHLVDYGWTKQMKDLGSKLRLLYFLFSLFYNSYQYQ